MPQTISEAIEQLRKKLKICRRCGKNRFWAFPNNYGVKGFSGSKDVIFVCSQPHEGVFDPSSFGNRLDRRFYDTLRQSGFEDAHLTDMVKCRRKKYNELDESDVRNCLNWLKEEVNIIKPMVVIAVGNKAFSELKLNNFEPVLQVPHYSNYFIPDEEYKEIFLRLRKLIDSNKFRHGMKLVKKIDSNQIRGEEEKYAFSDFIALLSKKKNEGKISGSQWRDYRDQWQKNPKERQVLIQKIELM